MARKMENSGQNSCIKSGFALYIIYLLNLPCMVRGFDLTLIHTNDVHARFEQVNKYGGPCHEKDLQVNKCYGGIARRKTAVDTIRRLSGNVLFLDAGDQFQGTLWFYIHKGQAAAHFMNKLGYNAMALGNHEFDNGIEGLMPFLNEVNFTVLGSNIDCSQEPEVGQIIVSSKVFRYGTKQVGVIGYTTAETPELSSPGNLVFRDEAKAIQREVEKLRHEGIEILIAVGHAGYKKDLEIARTIEGLDIVVGGHTNTLLFNGETDIGTSVGSYPTVVTQASNHKVLVLQEYAFGIYLGYLRVEFSEEGNLLYWTGNPILLNHSVPEDVGMLEDMKLWQEPVSNLSSKIIGDTEVFLNGSKEACRLGECNMGNVIADGLLYHFSKDLTNGFLPADAAILNGGSIRSSLDVGNITSGDLTLVQPFQNTIDLVELRGEHLKVVLEHSVMGDLTEKHGRFLQVAGLKFFVDVLQPDGSRVLGICVKDIAGTYQALDDNFVYRIVIPSFVIGGGDGYDMIKQYAVRHEIFERHDVELTMDYISTHSPLRTEVEGRIKYISTLDNKEPWHLPCDTTPTVSSATMNYSTMVSYITTPFITLLVHHWN